MGDAPLVVMHVNPTLSHQMEHAVAFQDGFRRFQQYRFKVSHDQTTPAAYHIVSGPHFALRQWVGHPRTVLLDVAHYGCQKTTFSVGWILPDGSRHFPKAKGNRALPYVLPRRAGNQVIVLGDYGQDRDAALRLFARIGPCSFRAHPHDPWLGCPVPIAEGPLDQVLASFHVAYGWRSSALTSAALAGLEVRPQWDGHFCAWLALRKFSAWCEDLAWMHWSLADIASGACWEWLRATEADLDALGAVPAA